MPEANSLRKKGLRAKADSPGTQKKRKSDAARALKPEESVNEDKAPRAKKKKKRKPAGFPILQALEGDGFAATVDVGEVVVPDEPVAAAAESLREPGDSRKSKRLLDTTSGLPAVQTLPNDIGLEFDLGRMELVCELTQDVVNKIAVGVANGSDVSTMCHYYSIDRNAVAKWCMVGDKVLSGLVESPTDFDLLCSRFVLALRKASAAYELFLDRKVHSPSSSNFMQYWQIAKNRLPTYRENRKEDAEDSVPDEAFA